MEKKTSVIIPTGSRMLSLPSEHCPLRTAPGETGVVADYETLPILVLEASERLLPLVGI